jgi:hypothetical protein
MFDFSTSYVYYVLFQIGSFYTDEDLHPEKLNPPIALWAIR